MQLIMIGLVFLSTSLFAAAPSGSASKADIQKQEELKRLEHVKFHTRDDEKILKPSKDMQDYTNLKEKRDNIPKSNILKNPNP